MGEPYQDEALPSAAELADVFLCVERSAVLSPAAKRLFVHLWIEAGCRCRAIAFEARHYAKLMAADCRTVRRALELLSREGWIEVFAGGRRAAVVTPIVADPTAARARSAGGPNCAQKCPRLTNDTNARPPKNHPSAGTNEGAPRLAAPTTSAGNSLGSANQNARDAQQGPQPLAAVVAAAGGVPGLIEESATAATMRRNHWAVRLCQAMGIERTNYLVVTTLKLLAARRLEEGQLADVLWELSDEAQAAIGRPIHNKAAVYRVKMQRRGFGEFARRRRA